MVKNSQKLDRFFTDFFTGMVGFGWTGFDQVGLSRMRRTDRRGRTDQTGRTGRTEGSFDFSFHAAKKC